MKKIMVIAVLTMALLLSVLGCKKETVSIEITKEPNTLYFVNDAFDYKGGELTVTRTKGDDSSSEAMALNDSRVSVTGFDSSKTANQQTVTIGFEKLEKTLEVAIVEATAVSISTMPQRTYGIDDPFNPAEGKLNVTLTNGTTRTVAIKDIPEEDILGFDTTEPGINKEVKIKYRGLETVPFYVTVQDKTIRSIKVTTLPTQMDYLTNKNGETKLNPAGGKLTVTRTNGDVETINLDSDEIKNNIKYDFRIRGLKDAEGRVANSKVTVEFGGYQTEFYVNLTSQLIRIEAVSPKGTYIVNEPFYYGLGSILLVYEDGMNEDLLLTNANIKVSDTFTTTAVNGDLKYQIVYKHTDGLEYRTAELSAVVKTGGKASEVMAEYVKLTDVLVNWTDAVTDMDNDQRVIARNMYNLYKETTNISDISYYINRIISLKLAADYMESYSDAKLISSTTAAGVYNINTAEENGETFDEVIGNFMQTLSDFRSDYAGFITALTGYNTDHEKVVLESNISVETVFNAIKGAYTYSVTVKENIDKVLPYYEGYKAIPNEVVSGQKVTAYAAGIETAFAEIQSTVSDNALRDLNNSIIPTLTAWRADYVEIMLEHLYMKSNKVISGDIETLLEKVNVTYFEELNELIRLFYAHAAGYAYEDPSTAYYLEMFAYSSMAIEITEYVYNLGYESVIAIYEDYKYGGSTSVPFEQMYDDMIATARYGMYNRMGSYYIPSGELKEFLNVFNPIMKKYYEYSRNSAGSSYQPTSALFERDVLALQEAFYKLNSWDKAYAFHIFSDAVALRAMISDYLGTKFSATEKTVMNSSFEVEHYFYIYVVSMNTSVTAITDLNSAISRYRSAYGGLTNKTNYNANMKLQMQFIDSIDTWIAYYLDDSTWMTGALTSAASAFRLTYNSLSSEFPKELFATYFRELDVFVKRLNETELDEFKSVGVFLPDDISYYEFYLNLQDIVLGNLAVQESDNETVEEAFDLYLSMIFMYANYGVVYAPGNSDYNKDVQKLRGLLFDFTDNKMDVDSLLFFIKNLVDVNYTPLFNDFLIPHGIGMYTDAAKTNYISGELKVEKEKDAYLALIQTIKYYVMYEAGYATFDDLHSIVISYLNAYDAIGDNAAKVTFNIFAQLELDFFDEYIRPFVFGILYVTGIEGDADLNSEASRIVSTITLALAAYRYNSNFLLMEGIVQQVKETISQLSAADRAIVEQTEMYIGTDYTMTVARFIEGLDNIYKSLRLITMSDDPLTREAFEILAVEVAKFHTDYRDKLGTDGFEININTMLQAYMEKNPDWTTTIGRLFDLYMSMSSQQRGAFGNLQTSQGIESQMIYEYFRIFVTEYLSYTVDSEGYILPANRTNTTKFGKLHNIVTSFVAAIDSYSRFQVGVFSVSDTSNDKNQPRFIEFMAETVDSYDKLTSAEKAKFNAVLDEYYVYYAELRSLLSGRTGIVKMAIDNFSFAIDTLSFSDTGVITPRLGDYTLFVKFYKEIKVAFSSFDTNQRLSFNDTRFKGHANVERKLSEWMTIFEDIYRGFDVDGIEVFYKQYIFVASRFIDGYAGVDLLIFGTEFYPGDFIADMELMLERYAQLTDAQRAKFLAISGHTFRGMLRYYYASSLTLDEYFIWYDFCMATFDYHNGGSIADLATAMTGIEARLAATDTTLFDQYLGGENGEYTRYVEICENL